MSDSKSLVAYFSASGGTTKRIAELVAQATGADVFAIEPVTPYTQADLDWRDEHSRTTVESHDESARPPIAGKVADMAQYDTVYLGFPIWWYREPRIIDTFLEAYDFAGKTIIPFATSGSSEMGDTASYIQKLAPAAKVEKGARLSANATLEDIKRFVG